MPASSLADRFILGERLAYEHAHWCPRMGLTVFYFRDDLGVTRRLDIYDEDDLDRWRTVFAEEPPPLTPTATAA